MMLTVKYHSDSFMTLLAIIAPVTIILEFKSLAELAVTLAG